MSNSATAWTAARQLLFSFTISQSLLRFMSIESVMLSYHLILCLILLLLSSVFLSIKVFSNESALHIKWPKYWSFSFSISPSNEYSGLISFRNFWLDLLKVQGILNCLLQHHYLNASVLQHPSFFMVQLPHPHMTIGKTIALTIWTFVSKMMSAFCLGLPRFVCSSFSSKEQESFDFVAVVTVCSDFGAQENKICHCCYFFPFYLP